MPQPTFDDIYANVPAEQVARLKGFRRTHPYKHLSAGEAEWQYITCGLGTETLLLLPGALAVGESMFPLITSLENDYRLIAPSYALASTMDGLCDGLARILEAEGVDRAHVFGGSYGGLVAQYFVRRHQEKVLSLILSHTFIITSKYTKPMWLAGKLFPALPQSLVVKLLKMRLNKILLSKLHASNHVEEEFWRAYLNEAIVAGRLNNAFKHQNLALLDLAQRPQFTEKDLAGWRGRILIIESDDDPAIPLRSRTLLKSIYPRAEVHTFEDAGHASLILKRDEVVSIIEQFLSSLKQNQGSDRIIQS